VNVAVAIGGLALLIILHEAGHFFAALAVKMRPRKFYLFFPPALVKRVRNGIEYGIGAIPLGGYVKIPGMHPPAGGDLRAQLGEAVSEAPWLEGHVERVAQAVDAKLLEDARAELPRLREAVEKASLSERARNAAERGLTDLEDTLAPDAYWRAPVWKRITVIFAGPGTNLLFAIVLLAIVYMAGVPVAATNKVDRLVAASPAAAMGLRAGDRILAVDGKPVDADSISKTIRASGGSPITLAVERDGARIRLGPARAKKLDGAYRLGFVLGTRNESYGPAKSVTLAAQQTWSVTEQIGRALAQLPTRSGREQISSPVGIVEGSSQALNEGFRVYLEILAFISLSLALLNLLPLLPLDGGHIAFSIVEKLRGRAIPREAYEKASAFGIAVVLLLFVLGLSNDVGRLNGG
jgi:regulator of sigma E protease